MKDLPNECLMSNKSAIECLNIGGFFYDVCTGHCERELSFLRLGQYLQLEHIVYGYLFPLLVLLVVVANLLVALVLSQKHMVSPTNLVLKYMAIADLCVGLFPLPWNFYYHTLRHFENEQKELQLWWCYAYKYSMDAIPPVCHNIAMWLTVLLAGQRYLFIRYPMNSRMICSLRNVRIATFFIMVVSLICGLPKCVDYHFAIYEGWVFVESGHLIYLRTCLSGFTVFVRFFGSNAFFNAYFWTRVVGFILLPSFLLICLNALLIKSIRKAQQRKKRLLMLSISGDKRKRDFTANRQITESNTSIMLVIIVSIFLIVNLPQALFMAMLCVYNTLGLRNGLLEGLFPVTFLLVNNMLVMATYPINFGIYCFMSSSFRDTFRMVFCREDRNTQWAVVMKSQRLTDNRRLTSISGLASETTRITSIVRRSTDPINGQGKKYIKERNVGRASLPTATSYSVISESKNNDSPPYDGSKNGEETENLKIFIIGCSSLNKNNGKVKKNKYEKNECDTSIEETELRHYEDKGGISHASMIIDDTVFKI
ncbi:G_PROTEIN_RECEP_F1_2 domain-containing protein [Meloidogyne graminicola]|uniref:G_PROTEIN_RECEP_F1_2 domain-containing protein n=1 Tax=Meloidogyne graminicola TaxID=189291 RepID=A0A8S9ZZN1_9BILA|nr:G_PROTEIN_RECEP_F1_2 domain-containing protein [Meloidogyne graminicola]